jgi:hypothetical protein
MTQLISVTSEALQAAIRRLLPSQAGFSEDLEAVNTIQPIIDLTTIAEGTPIPLDLSQALSKTSTGFTASNSSVDVATASGFYRVVGSICIVPDTSANIGSFISITDGFTSRNIYGFFNRPSSNKSLSVTSFDILAFVAVGETMSVNTDNTGAVMVGTSRQVADSNGVLINPPGFTPQ